MKQKLKRILACVLVLCMGFGVQSNLVWAQENDDVIVQENVTDYMSDMTDDTDTTDDTTGATTDDTKNTDTTGDDDVITKTESEPTKQNRSITPTSEITPQSDDILSGNCGATENDNVTWKLEQNNEDNDNPTYTLTISGTGAMSDFVIKPTDLRPWGGEYCGKITQINLSEGITVIGSYAFCRLTNLESCEIPASIIEIKNNAFSGAGFTNLAFEKNCQLKTIGNGAFYGSSNLEIDFVIPDSVESIGNLAFQGSGIKSLTIGSGVKNIGDSAFSACSNLTGELNIPDGVKSIGGNAFNSSPIKSVTFGSGIENIGGNAFLRSAGQDKVALVKHEFVVTDKMKEIQNSTFAGLDVSVLKIEAGSETTFKPYSVAHLSNQIHSVVFLSDTYPTFEANSFQNTVLSIIYGRSNSVKEALKAVMPSGTSANTIYAITKGGTFEVGTSFEAGKLATPTKEGSIFEGWYDNAQFTTNKVTTAESGNYVKLEIM